MATNARQVHRVSRHLSEQYGNFAHFNRRNPLEELLFIICSIQTNEGLYRHTFSSLRAAFPRFRDLAEASQSEIAAAIELGGLAQQKARKISRVMSQLVEHFGKPTLSPLREMSGEECEAFLTSLYGVGKKTARCVMLYSLGYNVFPVDTHCWRISKRLGWVRPTRPDRSCSPRDMDRLQAKIPPKLRYPLHVNMVSLGRQVCTQRVAICDKCPIRSCCRRVGIAD